MKVLILFSTRFGMTEKTANVISSILSNDFDHEVHCFRDNIPNDLLDEIGNFD